MREKYITFKIDKIEVLSYSINSSKIAPKYNQPLDFNYSLKFEFTPPQKKLSIFLNLVVSPKSKKGISVSQLEILMQFTVKNMEEFMDKEKNKIKLPDIFLTNLISIVVSTTRGVWAEKTRGTKLQKQIFPLVNPKEILKKIKNNQF